MAHRSATEATTMVKPPTRDAAYIAITPSYTTEVGKQIPKHSNSDRRRSLSDYRDNSRSTMNDDSGLTRSGINRFAPTRHVS